MTNPTINKATRMSKGWKTGDTTSTAITMMTKRIWGIERKMSTIRISASSTQPPKNPEIAPTRRPIRAPVPTIATETPSDQSDPRNRPA